MCVWVGGCVVGVGGGGWVGVWGWVYVCMHVCIYVCVIHTIGMSSPRALPYSPPSLLFSLVALYFLNRISHSVYAAAPPPTSAKAVGAHGKSPSAKGKVKHG